MATLTQVTLTCDMCGNATDVQTQTIGLDGKTFDVDLCQEDRKRLHQAVAGYVAKARKSAARQRPRRNVRKPRSGDGAAATDGSAGAPGREIPGRSQAAGAAPGKTQASRPKQQAAKGSAAKAKAAGSARKQAQAGGSKQDKAKAAARRAAKATVSQQGKGIYVYGILPADIEMTADMPGVGEPPGLLRVVRFNGLAALISEVDLSSRLGSPDDLRTHTDILDATATEVPVVPLPSGIVLNSEDAVAEKLLAAHREEFADALEQLEGRAEFVVKARYLQEAVLGEVLPEKEQAARLGDKIQGEDPGAARGAGIELGEIISEAVTARPEEDTRTVREAMDGHCVASVVREPTHELDAVHVAFLVDADQESEVERVIADLARDWAGQIEVQLLGPMAAYDFVRTPKPEG